MRQFLLLKFKNQRRWIMRDFQHGINTFPSHLFLRREYVIFENGVVPLKCHHLTC